MNSVWWDLKDNEKHTSVLLFFFKWEGGGIYHKNDRTMLLSICKICEIYNKYLWHYDIVF